MENNLFFDIFGTVVFGAIGVICAWKGISGIIKPTPKCNGAFDKVMKVAGWIIAPIGLAIITAIVVLWTQR